MSATEEPRLVRVVLSYFKRNPQSADTLEGVAKWRLLEQTVHWTVQETDRALVWLVEKGFLREINAAHADRLFCLNAGRLDEVEDYMRKAHREPREEDAKEG